MKDEIRIIIAGSRKFNDYKKLEHSLHIILHTLSKEGILSGNIKDDIKKIVIVSGEAEGADRLGEEFARNYKIRVKGFPAKWSDLSLKPCVVRTRNNGAQYNVLAGLNRNSMMADYATEVSNAVLIAFWDMKSTGTKNMVEIAKKKDMRVFIEKI